MPGGKALLISTDVGAVQVSLETLEQEVLLENVIYARYLPPGYLVYVRAGTVEAVAFDLAKRKPTGSAVPVVPNVLSDSIYGVAQFAFSDNGHLVYVPGGDTARSRPVWVDGHNNTELLDMDAQVYGSFKLSPDNEHLAISVKKQGRDIYVYNLERGTETRLTRGGTNDYPIWTPDGGRVVFSRNEADGQWYILSASADGTGKADLLWSSQHELKPYSWSSDGKLLALYQFNPPGGYDIVGLDIAEGSELEAIWKTDFGEWHPALSPDDRHMAYTSDKDSGFQVYVRPYPNPGDWVERISLESGEDPIWSTNGDRLFYRDGDKCLEVPISTEPKFHADAPDVVFEGWYMNVAGVSLRRCPRRPALPRSQVTVRRL